MKLDDESETKGLSSMICLAVAVFIILGWTAVSSLGVLDNMVGWMKTL